MRKNFIYAVMLLLGFTACRKTEVEDIFYASPEQRMADTLNFIRNELKTAQYGWKGGFATGLKGGYGFYFQFDADQNVSMLSDYSTTSGTDLKKSTYRVSPTNTPSLLFDTYNYISIMQDPVPGVAGGTAGQGYKSDIEFIYVGKKGDSLLFKGKKYSYPLTLIKLGQNEQQSYLNGGINSYKTNFAAAYNNNYMFSYLSGGQNGNLAVDVDYAGKIIKFSYVNASGSVTSIVSSPFYYTTSALNLVRSYYVPYNGKLIKGLTYQGNKVQLIFTDGTTTELASQNSPLYKLDLVFDYNKTFKKLVAGDPIPGVTANVPIFDKVRELFTTSGRTINTMYFAFTNSTTAIFYIAYTSGTSPFVASATYQYRREGNRLWLKRTGIDGGNNWNTRSVQVAPVDALFGTGDEREFVLDWAASSDISVKFPIGAIKSATNLNNMLYGRLGE
ncbi:DUF4302 domain-containing protein [Pedobacter sp.]|uniref:DUF4302 domain-containing protein n=1 Tax=Pedobacter sp. TaxID=1411316 RepID=UPI00396C701F